MGYHVDMPFFDLVSHKTGAVIKMRQDEVIRDRDGDIVSWNYVPVSDKRITSVIILND